MRFLKIAIPVAVLLFAVTANAQSIKDTLRSGVSLDYEYENFDRDFQAWNLLSLELSHKFDFGSVIGRVNHARRFGEWGNQYEIDAYPGLGKGRYAYLNIGRSTDVSYFPEWRYGAEIFQSLPHALETSLGMRRLEFQSTDVTLYTGSLAMYRGNYYLSARPYYSQTAGENNWSGGVQLRRYFATADDYMTVGASYGKGVGEEIRPQELARLNSWAVRLSRQKAVAHKFIVSGRAGYQDEEFRLGLHRKSYWLGVGLERRF